MRLVFLAIAFMLAAAWPCQAEGLDVRNGEQLFAACQSRQPEEAASCRNYVTIVTETILTARATGLVCFFVPPDGFTEDQAMAAAMDYLTAHPEMRSLSGAKNVIDALAAKYPCPQ